MRTMPDTPSEWYKLGFAVRDSKAWKCADGCVAVNTATGDLWTRTGYCWRRHDGTSQSPATEELLVPDFRVGATQGVGLARLRKLLEDEYVRIVYAMDMEALVSDMRCAVISTEGGRIGPWCAHYGEAIARTLIRLGEEDGGRVVLPSRRESSATV